MKKETCITISEKTSKNKGGTYIEDLRTAIRASDLQDDSKEETFSNTDGYNIWFEKKGDAKKAWQGIQKNLKTYNSWDNSKFKSFKGKFSWDVYYYDAAAVLVMINNIDNANEDDII